MTLSMHPDSTPAGSQPAPEPTPALTTRQARIKVFGVGSAGISVIDHLVRSGLPSSAFVAVNADETALAGSLAAEKAKLETPALRGMGTGGDPDRGRRVAEEQVASLKALCQNTDLVFIVAGLGGGSGTGISPVLARAAKEAGALVIGFVKTPFDCEGSRRRILAMEGLEDLKAAADGVIALPNQKVCQLLDENTSVLETFQRTNELLADGVRGVWRLLTMPGLIEIRFDELCNLIRDQHCESAFAVAEAMGATRSREVVDKLFAHPLLDGGDILAESGAVLVSLMAGPDLTMVEVRRVMEQINSKCPQAQVMMGAAIHDDFRDRLAVTLIASRKTNEPAPHNRAEDLSKHLLDSAPEARPGSRFVPPPPLLPQDRIKELARKGGRGRNASQRMRQGQLPLEIVSKGRFDKSEPTIHKGEDLDVPTYIRRGISLN